MHSDRHAYTITRVSSSGKTFWMKQDAVQALHEGHTENQKYSYKPDPNAPEEMVRKTKNGWKCGRGRVVVGIRDEYYDNSF
jgi:hypothetical protein